jgi:pimeloyl-ACP methyl ester carboxylesterase
MRWILKGMLALVAVVVLTVASGLGYRAWRQHEGESLMRIAAPNGIDERMYVELGGTEQWVTIRGQDRHNPAILMLHGGPGVTLGWLATTFVPWERKFTIVQWDQPGAGRTHRAASGIIDPGLTIESMARDGNELAEFLRRYLGKEKIIVLGWSWGSVLGLHMIKARPDLYAAYVGTGQVVSFREAEALAYTSVLTKARQRGDPVAIAELERIGAPPYGSSEGVGIQRDWATRYELGRSLAAWSLVALFAPRTTLVDVYYSDSGASIAHFVGPARTGPLITMDLRELGPDFAVPIFVVQGTEDDWQPAELSRAFVTQISAPRKEFVPIDGAGHFALTEHSDEFLRILVERVRPLAAEAD